MRKSVTGSASAVPAREWLDLEFIASVEVSSEAPSHPVEGALQLAEGANGWRAAGPGEQKITILFDAPTLVHRIHLEFLETDMARTQEFALHWTGTDANRHEVVRQQWNFSPTGATSQIEDYQVALAGVTRLELTIKPDLSSSSSAVASLERMRLA
jgi:hypothetical protein